MESSFNIIEYLCRDDKHWYYVGQTACSKNAHKFNAECVE